MATIAVIDDSPSIRKIFEYCLEDMGHTALFASNGAEGLKLLAENWVDVVLVDANMPVMNGLALCEAVRANPLMGHLPIVMMTACISRDLVARALAAGAREVLSKPFDVAEVEAKLQQHAENAAQLRLGPASALTSSQVRMLSNLC
jgi:CheY-like chemotaxis protein